MPVSSLLAVLLAAVLHAVWHLLSKRARDASAFMWWGITVGAIWYGLVLGSNRSLALPAQVWAIYVLSIGAEIASVALVAAGYRFGDLSQVYPIARGTPPLMIALWSAIFLGERLPVAGYLGVAALMVGVYLCSLPSPRDVLRPVAALGNRPAQLAMLAAVCVSVYSVLDKSAVALVDPLVYNFWVYFGISIGYAAFVWTGPRRARTLSEWRTNWRWVLAGSLATVGSYMLALIVMSTAPASYVGAVRATSVLIGALMGWLALRETFGIMRVAAAGVIAVGLVAIAIAT